MIRKIGLTGGIGSGKSRVAAMLAPMLDCVRLDADEVCRRLLEPRAEGWQEVARIHGSKYLGADGRINRPFLRRDLFVDAALRQQLNSIIHPLARREITSRMDQIIAADPGARVLVEVPLLYEAGWQKLFDTVVVVYADYETCLNRLMQRENKDRPAAEREMESQLPLAEKVKRADYVIDNSGKLSATHEQVKRLAELLLGHDQTRPTF